MLPARGIIEKCGGPKRTSELAKCSINWVYRWVTSVESGGTGGRVPERARRQLLEASRAGEVDLQPADFESDWPVDDRLNELTTEGLPLLPDHGTEEGPGHEHAIAQIS